MAEDELFIVSVEQMLQRGLELVGFTTKQIQGVRKRKNLSRFRAHYTNGPLVYSLIFRKLQETANDAANILPFFRKVGKKQAFDYFLMSIHLLACYPTEEEAEAIFKISNVTWSNWVWEYVARISLLFPETVTFPDRWNNKETGDTREPIFIITVDGVHCPILEPTLRNFEENKPFFSHKFHRAALDYELGISIFTQQCVWVSGPYPAGTNDITVFRASLKGRMQEARDRNDVDYRALGDRGYRGERNYISIPSSHDEEEVRDFKGRALSRHETFNGRLKNFDALQQLFRHSIAKHNQCFRAGVVIVQTSLENGSPLFEV